MITFLRSEWTDERVKRLRFLKSEGFSASDIARQLGGISRNAVIGKLSRLGLGGSAKQNSEKFISERQRVKRIKERAKERGVRTPYKLHLEVAPVSEPIPDGPVVALADLEPFHCRFPYGDPKEKNFGFCGCAKVQGSPYCAAHMRVAYVMETPKREQVHVAKTDGKVFA